MEVCIFGVLTVNLLTFCSQNAPLPSELPSLPMPVKRRLAEPWQKKAQTPCYSPFYGLI